MSTEAETKVVESSLDDEFKTTIKSELEELKK